MSEQKKLDKMDMIELVSEKPKPEFHFKEARTPGRYIFQTENLVIGYDEPLSSLYLWKWKGTENCSDRGKWNRKNNIT